MKALLKDRPALDIVVIGLTVTVMFVIVLSTLAIIVGKLLHPEADFKAGAEEIGSIVTTIVGALVGFVGGRAAGRMEGAEAAAASHQTTTNSPQ